jgi:hypothetical protein
MMALAKNPFVTLKLIGDKHGVSREYIRQICPTMLGRGYTEIMQEKRRAMKDELTTMGCKYDPRQKLITNPSCSSAIGTNVEVEVMEICRDLGLDCLPYKGNAIDLVIENKPVDVKSASKSFSPLLSHRRYYRFKISKKQRNLCSHFICKIPGDVFYIIPAHVMKKGNIIYIPENESRYARRNVYSPTGISSSFPRYEEAWELFLSNS